VPNETGKADGTLAGAGAIDGVVETDGMMRWVPATRLGGRGGGKSAILKDTEREGGHRLTVYSSYWGFYGK
jgi:hypothetical protein